MKARHVLIAVVAFSLTHMSHAAAAVVTASPSHEISTTSVGGLPLSATFKGAVNHFGDAGAETRFDSAGCTIDYPNLGVDLWYSGNPLESGTPDRCAYFQGGAVSAHGWRTPSGLAVGDSTAQLRTFYPHVYNTRRAGPKWDSPAGSIEWDITITSCGGALGPALYAMVKRDRVVAIGIEMVGH